jgi:hypothetical protein
MVKKMRKEDEGLGGNEGEKKKGEDMNEMGEMVGPSKRDYQKFEAS